MYLLRSSPIFLRLSGGRAHRVHNLRCKLNAVDGAVPRELLWNVVILYPPNLPCAIEMFETRRSESLLGLIAKDKIGFSDLAVLVLVPAPANREIPQKVVRRVRAEWNGHDGVEEFARFLEVRIRAGKVEKPEFGKLAEERQIRFEVPHEFAQIRFGRLDVRKRDHRWCRRAVVIHRETVDEVTDRGLGVRVSVIGLGREMVGRDAAVLFEVGAFIRLSFEIGQIEVSQDKIEHRQPSLHVGNLVFPAVAKVFTSEMAIELARKDVIDDAVLGKALC